MNTYDIQQALVANESDAWARHAHASNGFGDAGVADSGEVAGTVHAPPWTPHKSAPRLDATRSASRFPSASAGISIAT